MTTRQSKIIPKANNTLPPAINPTLVEQLQSDGLSIVALVDDLLLLATGGLVVFSASAF